MYIYKKETLSKIVSMPQTRNEKKFKLEQLRALENKIAVGVCLAKQIPIGVRYYRLQDLHYLALEWAIDATVFQRLR